MTRHQESELRYGVDRLLVRGKRLFGWGWAAHPARAIESMSLCLGDAGFVTSLGHVLYLAMWTAAGTIVAHWTFARRLVV